MELTNERKTDWVEFDIDLSDEESDRLVKYAQENIFKDQSALINWSVNDIFKKMVDKLDNDPKKVETLLKGKLKAKKALKRGKNTTND